MYRRFCAQVKDAARADAAALLLHLLGTENNCRVLRQRHHQVRRRADRQIGVARDGDLLPIMSVSNRFAILFLWDLVEMWR